MADKTGTASADGEAERGSILRAERDRLARIRALSWEIGAPIVAAIGAAVASLGVATGAITAYLAGVALVGGGIYGFALLGVWAERKGAMLPVWQENPMPRTFRSMARTWSPSLSFALLVYGVVSVAGSPQIAISIAEIIIASVGAGLLIALTFLRIARISEREDHQLRRLFSVPFEEMARRARNLVAAAGHEREPSSAARRHTRWAPVELAGLKGEVRLISGRRWGTFVLLRRSVAPEALAQSLDAFLG